MGSVAAARGFWWQASQYPADKEAVYPEHAEAQEFDKHGGARVLEYGCGGGADAMSFLRRGCTVWYADVVPENVKVAESRILAAQLEAHAFPLTLDQSVPLPAVDGYFDVVSAHGVLHHVEEPGPILAEFFRVVKRRGLVYVMLYTEALWAEFRSRIDELVATGVGPEQAFGWCTDGRGCPYARPYEEAEGRALLEEAGFKVTRAFTFNGGYFRTYRGVKP